MKHEFCEDFSIPDPEMQERPIPRSDEMRTSSELNECRIWCPGAEFYPQYSLFRVYTCSQIPGLDRGLRLRHPLPNLCDLLGYLVESRGERRGDGVHVSPEYLQTVDVEPKHFSPSPLKPCSIYIHQKQIFRDLTPSNREFRMVARGGGAPSSPLREKPTNQRNFFASVMDFVESSMTYCENSKSRAR